jgi:hypothetical protein
MQQRWAAILGFLRASVCRFLAPATQIKQRFIAGVCHPESKMYTFKKGIFPYRNMVVNFIKKRCYNIRIIIVYLFIKIITGRKA